MILHYFLIKLVLLANSQNNQYFYARNNSIQMLNKEERERYLRQLILTELGEEGQNKLTNAKVLIVGAGGLGGPVAMYLTAAGIGHIVLCDKDVVDLSNLNRQILHSTTDLNRAKSESAHETLTSLNPLVTVETYKIAIAKNNIMDFTNGVDIIVDCLDNIDTRMVLNQHAIENKIPIMHAGIEGWNGQLTLIAPPETLCLQCLFDSYEESDKPKPVLGAMAGVIGTMQALETIKYLAGIGENLKNTLAYYDALKMEWFKISIEKNKDCSACCKV